MGVVTIAGDTLVVASGVMALSAGRAAWSSGRVSARALSQWRCSAADRLSVLPGKMCSTACVAGAGEVAYVAGEEEAGTVVTGVSAPGRARGGGDRRERARSGPQAWVRTVCRSVHGGVRVSACVYHSEEACVAQKDAALGARLIGAVRWRRCCYGVRRQRQGRVLCNGNARLDGSKKSGGSEKDGSIPDRNGGGEGMSRGGANGSRRELNTADGDEDGAAVMESVTMSCLGG
jgi:hypothetical protein